MSSEPVADPAPSQPESTPDSRQNKAVQRLQAIRRSLQRQARRKLKGHEQEALELAAKLLFRAEHAALDPQSDSADVVRLANCARRARQDYLRIAGISTEAKAKPQPTMADLERELRAHG
jgi:hypothetical protein